MGVRRGHPGSLSRLTLRERTTLHVPSDQRIPRSTQAPGPGIRSRDPAHERPQRLERRILSIQASRLTRINHAHQGKQSAGRNAECVGLTLTRVSKTTERADQLRACPPPALRALSGVNSARVCWLQRFVVLVARQMFAMSTAQMSAMMITSAFTLRRFASRRSASCSCSCSHACSCRCAARRASRSR